MRFILAAGKMNPVTDKITDFADWFIGKEYEFFVKPSIEAEVSRGSVWWDWIYNAIPDLMGYGALLAGALVILSAMAGKGILKPMGIYCGALIVAALVRGGV